MMTTIFICYCVCVFVVIVFMHNATKGDPK